MASRPLMAPYQVITSGNMASASITSTVTIISNTTLVSYSLSWTGSTPVGVISVEVSNDYSENVDGSVRNSGNWTPMTLQGSTAVSGNTGTAMVNLAEMAAYACRLKYTRTSGTGTLQGYIVGKVY